MQLLRKLWWLATSRKPTSAEIDEFNLPEPEDMQAFCDGMGDPYRDGPMERDLAIRERLAALWELTFPDPNDKNPITLWRTLCFIWQVWRGPIVASAILLAVMIGVLLLTYDLVRP